MTPSFQLLWAQNLFSLLSQEKGVILEFWQGFWLVLGFVLILSELLLPGGIAFFVGLGALFVGLLYFLGAISSPLTGFTIWFILSITFLFTLKGFVDRFLPNTESKANTDEDIDAFGTEVEVTADIDYENAGRIEFQGTGWPAKSRVKGKKFQKGEKVKIVFRDNMTWLVDSFAQDDEITSDKSEDKNEDS